MTTTAIKEEIITKLQNDVVQGMNPRDFILSVASNIASQSLQNSDPQVWGVLTAISKNARKRNQGINILLTADEHCIGRLVEDVRFQIDSHSVSANHCRIYRMKVTKENMEDTMAIFLKDTSTNGTYLNWEKLKKNSAAVKVCHGDIISFSAPPQHEVAFAFVYREVSVSIPMPDNITAKRKAEEFFSENKRLKGLGIGAPEGPISLDDFRSLQRSNTDLRKQLENQVVLIDTLRNENRAAADLHESELNSVRESTEKRYLDQVKELQLIVDLKQKELVEFHKASAEQKHAMEDLNERLSASVQSCSEANDIISTQKVNIAELKEQLDEERTQRKEEREKAADDLKAAVQRAQYESQEELKRLTYASSRREREQQDAINKLQESEREQSLLVETLRSKLEDTRQKVVVSENKVRQLETQIHEEQLASANGLKRVEELEQETKRSRKELESEKAAREEAWAKVSVLELAITAAMRDLDSEKQRLKGARERLMLRETQLRAFYSTTEDIQKLFAKQQEQLKSMQRTLEDEENYDDTSVDLDGVIFGTSAREKEVAGYHNKNAAKAGSTSSQQKVNGNQLETSSDEASVTEKHDCDIRSQECQHTQEAEFTSADHDNSIRGGFGSDIDGTNTAPMMDGEAVETEGALETESPAINEQNIDLNKSVALVGDTLQFDDDVCVQEMEEHIETTSQEVLHHPQSNNAAETQKTIEEDTEVGDTFRTADLITSEVAGSWACSTAPSTDGENKYTRSKDKNEGSGALHDPNGVMADSQSNPSAAASATRENDRRALSEMIGIVAPELREQFGGSANDYNHEREKHGCLSDSETESCSRSGSDDDDIADAKGGLISDAETSTGNHVEEDQKQEDPMDEDDLSIQEDSLG
ncbi:putative transcription factor interactor and regulator FHA-SMAD family [Lupinus albus]|uniref:Putative transcription factor interactor and regulator FHA-SMAD family n=1 Tax=Lupinus albus TaxID=3870 RepID=A0A6A4QBN4_LUPAL|nr:putative transcription factor interactor and regulator FHA-SMAD family [Lupinus albus]